MESEGGLYMAHSPSRFMPRSGAEFVFFFHGFPIVDTGSLVFV